MDPGLDPGLAVLERTPRVVIDPAQVSAPHAPLDAVVGTSCIRRRDVRAWAGHGAMIASRRAMRSRKCRAPGSENSESWVSPVGFVGRTETGTPTTLPAPDWVSPDGLSDWVSPDGLSPALPLWPCARHILRDCFRATHACLTALGRLWQAPLACPFGVYL
jgi:hypothetical protein